MRFPETLVFGPSYHTVIAIYEKTPEDYRESDTQLAEIIRIEFPGYYHAREFYSPVYDHGQQDAGPDYRTTLYWDPEISIDDNGRTTVSFFTSDKSSAFRVVVEGVTHTGIPVYGTGEFRVEAEVNDR